MFVDSIFQITEETGKRFANWLQSAPEAIAKPEPKSKPADDLEAIRKGIEMIDSYIKTSDLAEDEHATWWSIANLHVGLSSDSKVHTIEQLRKIYADRAIIGAKVINSLNTQPI